MSMIEQQLKEIKTCAYAHETGGDAIYGTAAILYQAANTIEALSAKLAAATPKSPLEYEGHEDYDEGICPVCGNPVCDVYNYCPECGQHIKWRGGVYKEVDVMAGMNYTEKILTNYIIDRIHSCPFEDDCGIDFEKECAGLGEPGCMECIIKNIDKLEY